MRSRPRPRGGRGVAAALAAALLALLALTPAAHAGKIVDRVVAGEAEPGTAAGQFHNPSDIEVNDPGVADGATDPQGEPVDGYLYVVDERNHRVQAFDPEWNFEFMFGRGVLTGGDGAEVCDRTQLPCGAVEQIADDEEGEFRQPTAIAIDQQSGDLYVQEARNFRVQQFEADGTFVRTWGWGVQDGASEFQVCAAGCRRGIKGDNGGQLNELNSPRGIAIDGAPPHHVFVADRSRIQEFEPDGDFVRLWGFDVVPTGQPGDSGTNAIEICSSSEAGGCQRASLSGASEEIMPSRGLALDAATGVLYAGNPFAAVQRFDADAADAETLVLADVPGSKGASEVALHPGSGRLLAAFAYSDFFAETSHSFIEEYETAEEPPAAVDRHIEQAGGLSEGFVVEGLEADPASGDLYLATKSFGHRVYAADDDGASPPPALSLDDPASAVNGLSVTFSGTVTPGGPPGIGTTYDFQYRKVGSGEEGWIAVPGSENPLGDGNEAIEVSDEVDDLQPNVLYEARLVARKAFGNPEAKSGALPFASDPLPPEAETIAPPSRGTTSALLAARINPNNSATSYRFEWGETEAYGNAFPIPDGDAGDDFGERLITARVEGLNPETTYHYRVVADNGIEEGPGDTEVEGEDVSFTTRAATPVQGERAYEMVTPPFKVTRATGFPEGRPGDNPNPAIPSLDGDSAHWNVSILPLSDDVEGALTGDRRIIRRTAAGWVNSTRNTLGLLEGTDPFDALFSPAYLTKANPVGSSGDFETLTWVVDGNRPTSAGLLPTEGAYANRTYTRRDGTGVNGFTPWLANPEQQVVDQGFEAEEAIEFASADKAILDDPGTAMARWGHYRGLGELPGGGDEDPSDEQQLPGQRGGASAYLVRADDPDELPGTPKELVNECTGTQAEADATLIPRRVGLGEETDTIGTQPCEEGEVTNVRGAVVGNRGDGDFKAATALAEGGERVFFQSPDPAAATTATGTTIDPSIKACAPSFGAFTACPPQLYVRSRGPEGEPIVRWVSRSRSEAAGEGVWGGAMIVAQRVAEMGAGARFEGASRDGSVVYFRTDSPLVPDDPNGGESITAGSASSDSWDLYRYVLPAGPGADPEDGSLLRVSGGPSGAADPSTNEHEGQDATLRFHSDDGSRTYFLTTAPIAGADEEPPAGGATAPGGEPGNTSTRNLYLFDAGEEGAARWRFIARLPYGAPGTTATLDACATSGEQLTEQLRAAPRPGPGPDGNCFRGTPGGEAVLFTTTGRLSGDDFDAATDVYLYDARADELVRLSAPPPGEQAYICHEGLGDAVLGHCNGELGRNTGDGFFSRPIGPWELSRGWGGMRYQNLALDGNGALSAYFATTLPLLPADANEHMDVYQWREGELSLISPGDTEDHSWFSGNSLDGRDVFFATGARLDPREIDDADLDVYDARIGGGLPYTPPPEPCEVLALECESEAIEAPPVPAVATGAAAPSANLAARRPVRRCAKPARNAKRAASKAKRLRRAARRARGPRARRAAKRAWRSAKAARRASKAAKRCRRRARAGRGAGR